MDESHEYGKPIGIYDNPPGIEPERLVITEQALGYWDGGLTRWIPFDDIETIEGPREKRDSDAVLIVLKSGVRTTLRVGGKDGRFKDVFSFVRFIDRVVGDRRPAS